MAEKDQRLNEIPKLIHYCWFGGNELPDLALKCIESWKKYCPDYEIIEWGLDYQVLQHSNLLLVQLLMDYTMI